ncbi:Eco57I restriction-modification methylase domain-containing protein [Mesorhizobium sp. BH1-1-4]|uniref:Eco57I restriction-modification methylase domain-containing protein n=1 Tax=Mesorhizobium sp. BH1-1-4 TaxID=2876662 RepID=UPI001CD09055|nr:N-6 DNA methylase [Mesorhizobium sp. BH1-1-4]MBZ9994128.1 N-6 DNA methylase [Mesorhizobium sp. BH1-1-4]
MRTMVGSSPEYSQKRSGAYFTPDGVSAALVAWACRKSTDRLIDPSCGEGQFLALHRNSVGIEQNPVSAHRAIEHAPGALVHEGDFFTWAIETRERFECAAGNPPFIRYQTFKGDMRRRALDLCLHLGVRFSGLSSSWAPFIVATAGLLKRGGRMAFVVPAEIGHAPYAAPLLDYLVASFSIVQIVAVRKKLFPALSEDCWLLYTEGFGGKADKIDLTVVDEFVPARTPPKPTMQVDVGEWRTVWNRRLRPYLLPASVRGLYAATLADPHTHRLADFATVGIGYVSGDNDFFHLRPSDAKRLRIPSAFLQPSLRNGRAMPDKQITRATVEDWKRNDDPVLLLRLTRDQQLPTAVSNYLDSSAGREARQGYKCRNRAPWYAVPDVQIPDFVMSYMSGRNVNLVRNAAGVSCTNSLHAIRVRDQALASKLLPQWSSPFVRLSCELEGHALGGGMLKLEPREAGRIVFPSAATIRKTNDDQWEDAIGSLQRWRHYAD